jgi:2-polyprenyl-3-methyl-5-hydroxy-6-metoxy-1,4-benzoquinol methylase
MSNIYFEERKSCPACLGTKSEVLLDIPYSDEKLSNYLKAFYNSQGKIDLTFLISANYTLIKCLDCSLIYQKKIPDQKLSGILYEEWIDPSIASEKSKKHDLPYYKKHINEIVDIIEYFNRNPYELNFLDFGMGWSEWSRITLSMGVNTYGIELSQDRIQFAIKHHIEVLDYKNLPESFFDFINTEQVFEHIPNPFETLQDLTKSLKSGGVIKLSVPNGMYAERNIKMQNWETDKNDLESMNVVAPLEHINCYTTESLLIMAKKNGLELVKIRKPRYDYLSFKELIKTKLRPVLHKVRKPVLSDTSLMFRKK